MQRFTPLLALLVVGCASGATQAGPRPDVVGDEATIRALEEQVNRAVLDQDFATLERLWSPRFMVNTPRGDVAPNRNAVLDIFRQGIAHYSSYDHRIERLLIDGDIAIVMGAETVKPIGNAPLAGQTVERRFTNIWKRDGGTWRELARHANVVPPSAGTAPAAAAGREAEVRAAEERHRAAFLANDAAALDSMLPADFLVNSPQNRIVGKDELLGLPLSSAASSFSPLNTGSRASKTSSSEPRRSPASSAMSKSLSSCVARQRTRDPKSSTSLRSSASAAAASAASSKATDGGQPNLIFGDHHSPCVDRGVIGHPAPRVPLLRARVRRRERTVHALLD